MIATALKHSFRLLAPPMVFVAVSVAQTLPPTQPSLPQGPPPRQLTLGLDVDFRLEQGAASTKDRSVTLNFTVRERSGPSSGKLSQSTSGEPRFIHTALTGSDLNSICPSAMDAACRDFKSRLARW